MPERLNGTTTARGLPGGRVRRGGAPWRARRMALAIALGFVLAALPGLAPAQQPGAGSGTPNYILEISVEGNRNTGPNEVLTVIGSRAGSTIDPRMIVQDIKAVHALGYYDAVRVELAEKPGQGYLMIFQVKEKPKVGSLTVEGISRIDYTKTFEGFKLKAGGFFTQALLEQNHAVIRDAYRASGFLSVKIITTVDEDKQENTVDVTIRIEEAPRFYITDIRIHNTRVFSEMHLKRKMQSMEVDCFDWMNDSGVFDENKVNQDLQSISALYLEQGYIRLFIEKPKVVLIHNPDFSRIEVDIDISEGEQYFTGKIDVQGDILGSKERLMELIGLKTGNPYNPLQQNRDIFALSEVYQEQGYAFAQVRPDVRINDETKIVDVTYNIAKGEKAYIGRIEFQGNRETRDYVLRREFKVRENELFNGRKLRESHQALMALGYFDPSMKMDTEPTETSNVLDVVARVKETQTGTLQAQIGYSDSSGMLGSVSVSKGNFLGKGQTIRFSMQWAQKSVTKEFSADFIEPHLLDTDFTSETSASYRNVDDASELERGTIKEIRGSQGFGYPIWPPFKLDMSLSATNRIYTRKGMDSMKLRTFTTSLSYNTINHPIFPSAGSNIILTQSQIGGQVLGGSTEYRRYRLHYQKFISLNTESTLVFMAKMRMGWLEKVGNNTIPLEDRFRLGGMTSVRGFRSGEIGGPYGYRMKGLNEVTFLATDENGLPVIGSTGQPVKSTVDSRTIGFSESQLAQLAGGGTNERVFNLELLFPLAGDNVRGVVFYDAGQVNSEAHMYELLGEKEPEFFYLLQSIGGGIRLITPMGVFRFEYGYKLNPEKGETPDRFDFTISTLF